MDPPRLPKKLADDPGAARLTRELVARAAPLWAGGELRAPRLDVTPAVVAALRSAFSAGRIVRSFEDAERTLAAEETGLAQADRTSGVARGKRVSRLVILADDGSERFYRNVESLLRRHAPRVLALRVTADESALGALLFGPGQRARLLLVEHKDAVTQVLSALAAHWSDDADGG